MITKDGKVFRNLTEEVQYLSEKVAEHYERDRVLADYGIRVLGRYPSLEALEEAFPADEYTGAYGDCFLVGLGEPYTFYVFTRPFEEGEGNQWLDLGPLAIAGPPGEQGIPGERGEQGPQGIQGIQGEQGLMGPVGPRGPQGLKGDTGEKGKDGINGTPGDAVRIIGILTSTLQLQELDIESIPRDSAYIINIDGHDWLYFITGDEILSWDRVAFENGTLVYRNGFPQVEYDSDIKVDKITTPNKVYGTTEYGQPYEYGIDGQPGDLVMYQPESAIYCNTTAEPGIDSSQATNVSYVNGREEFLRNILVPRRTYNSAYDTVYAQGTEGEDGTGSSSMKVLGVSQESGNGGTLVQRTITGRIKCQDGIENDDVITYKQYNSIYTYNWMNMATASTKGTTLYNILYSANAASAAVSASTGWVIKLTGIGRTASMSTFMINGAGSFTEAIIYKASSSSWVAVGKSGGNTTYSFLSEVPTISGKASTVTLLVECRKVGY